MRAFFSPEFRYFFFPNELLKEGIKPEKKDADILL